MTRSSEARFWQAAGAIILVAGGLTLAYAFGKFGFASIEPRALRLGITASFLMLAGIAAFVSGRALHVEETALTAREGRLWNLLAAVCIIGGVVVVGMAHFQQAASIRDRLATGMAGAFALMMGVLCLLGERVMTHMHDITSSKGRQG